jgi:hypothetical protein
MTKLLILYNTHESRMVVMYLLMKFITKYHNHVCVMQFLFP